MKGSKDVAKAVAEGRDVNADLDGPASDRALAALEMKIAGASWTTIAKALDFNNHYDARKSVEVTLAQAARSPEKIEHARVLHSRRLERLLQSVMPNAVRSSHPDHLAYNARALAILDRIAALGGLNAPTQQVVYTPSSEQIEKYVAHLAVLASADAAATEADVIDADVVEEE